MINLKELCQYVNSSGNLKYIQDACAGAIGLEKLCLHNWGVVNSFCTIYYQHNYSSPMFRFYLLVMFHVRGVEEASSEGLWLVE